MGETKRHVKTAIRWRPLDENREIFIEKITETIIGVRTETYCFDHVFDSTSQKELFDVLVKPSIDKAIEGFDFTFVATGQTGSGKTFTMGFERNVIPEENGIAMRVFDFLFNHENSDNFDISISFTEIYNEQAYNLLSEKSNVPFYTKINGKFKGEFKQRVKSEAEVVNLLLGATKKRRIRGTKMNSISSRSHAKFTIYLDKKHEDKIRTSRINLIDLAGSECISKTGNVGNALQESKYINISVLAFKESIIALASKKFVRYRESVLTMLLEESLNARSYLTLLGCISPYEDDYGATTDTLKFIRDAKSMKLTPQQNELVDKYKKSKTPKKVLQNSNRIYQTPNSTSKQFKRPQDRPLSNIQNKLLARQLSEPRGSRFISRASKRMSAMYSTSKKSSIQNTNRSLRSSLGGQLNKSKIVTNLFAKKKTNESTFLNNESIDINLLNASASSVIEVEQKPIQSENLPKQTTSVTSPNNILEKHIKNIFAKQQIKINTPEREALIKELKNVNSNESGVATNLNNVEEPEATSRIAIESSALQVEQTEMKGIHENFLTPVKMSKKSINSDPLQLSLGNSSEIEIEASQTNRIADESMEVKQNDNIRLSTATDDHVHIMQKSDLPNESVNSKSNSLTDLQTSGQESKLLTTTNNVPIDLDDFQMMKCNSISMQFAELEMIDEVLDVNSIKGISELTESIDVTTHSETPEAPFNTDLSRSNLSNNTVIENVTSQINAIANKSMGLGQSDSNLLSTIMDHLPIEKKTDLSMEKINPECINSIFSQTFEQDAKLLNTNNVLIDSDDFQMEKFHVNSTQFVQPEMIDEVSCVDSTKKMTEISVSNEILEHVEILPISIDDNLPQSGLYKNEIIEKEVSESNVLPDNRMDIEQDDKICLTTTTGHVLISTINEQKSAFASKSIDSSIILKKDSFNNSSAFFEENYSDMNSRVIVEIFDNSFSVQNDENSPTFVSPIKIRKLEQIQDQSIYQIVGKNQNVQSVNENGIESLNVFYSNLEYEYPCEEQQKQSFVESKCVRSRPQLTVREKVIKANFDLPLSPRIILNRLESIYHNQQSSKRSLVHLMTENTRKAKQVKVTQAKRDKPKNTKMSSKKSTKQTITTEILTSNLSEAIQRRREEKLDILNNGNIKDLMTLNKIGFKRAVQIFTYRSDHGKFNTIDSLNNMPFWSHSLHQQFLIHNNLFK